MAPRITPASLREFRAAIRTFIQASEPGDRRDLDEARLSLVHEWASDGKLALAYSQAAKLDTIVRDVIPAKIWAALVEAAS